MRLNQRKLVALAFACVVLVCKLPACHGDEDGFEPIFDGNTLDGWFGALDGYEVVDGQLASRPGHGGKLYTKREFADFVLRFEFRLTPGANNGIGVRAPGEGDPAYEAMELQVLDNTAEKYAGLKEYQFHGSIYGVAPAKRGHLKPVGEWNQQEILCQGPRVVVTLNSEEILNVDITEAAPEGQTIDGQPHPGLTRPTGHIGLLGHGDRVYFRGLRVKSLQ